MKSFNDVSLSVLIVLFIVLVCEMLYMYKNRNSRDLISQIDCDGNGALSKSEFKYYVDNYIKKDNKMLNLTGLVKSASAGAIRGFLMGLLLNGVNGAITYATVLAVINPIITSIEHTL